MNDRRVFEAFLQKCQLELEETRRTLHEQIDKRLDILHVVYMYVKGLEELLSNSFPNVHYSPKGQSSAQLGYQLLANVKTEITDEETILPSCALCREIESKGSVRGEINNKKKKNKRIIVKKEQNALINDDEDNNEIEDPSVAEKVVFRLTCPNALCEHSTRFFESKNELNKHMSEQHDISPYRCLALGCKKKFMKKRRGKDLKHHIESEHAGLCLWKCSKCPKEFSHYLRLYQHIRLIHVRGSFKCKENGCTFVGRYRSERANHCNAQHPKEQPFVCRLNGCRRCYVFEKSLQTHQKRRHLNYVRYICT